MSTITENDLKEIKELISQLAKSQKEEFTQLTDKVNDMRVEIATVKEGLKSVDKRIDDAQSNINKRLDNLDFIARTVIGGVVVALIVGLTKLLYPNLIN